MNLLNGRQIDFIRGLKEAGAVTRESPFTVDKSADISPDELEKLVKIEVISRAAPYQYYLHADSRHAKLIAAMDARHRPDRVELSPMLPWTRERIVKSLIFWGLAVLIPILLIQLLGKTQ